MTSTKILAISGSTNNLSSNTRLLAWIKTSYPQADIEVMDDIAELPFFNTALDGDKTPEAIIHLRQRIEQVDALLFCTPEYVFSLPGAFKNVLEWLVSTTLLSGKPTAMIVAAASGQAAFESLDRILTTLECDLPDTNKLLIQGVKGKLNEKGIPNGETAGQIDHLMSALLDRI